MEENRAIIIFDTSGKVYGFNKAAYLSMDIKIPKYDFGNLERSYYFKLINKHFQEIQKLKGNHVRII